MCINIISNNFLMSYIKISIYITVEKIHARMRISNFSFVLLGLTSCESQYWYFYSKLIIFHTHHDINYSSNWCTPLQGKAIDHVEFLIFYFKLSKKFLLYKYILFDFSYSHAEPALGRSKRSTCFQPFLLSIIFVHILQ